MENAFCSITHQSINIKLKLKCGHEFEHRAVCEWLEKKHNCPMCRADANLDDLYLEDINNFYSSLSDNEAQNAIKILSDFTMQDHIMSKIDYACERSQLINFSYNFNLYKYKSFSLNICDDKLIRKSIKSKHFMVPLGKWLFVKWLIEIDFIAFLKCYFPIIDL